MMSISTRTTREEIAEIRRRLASEPPSRCTCPPATTFWEVSKFRQAGQTVHNNVPYGPFSDRCKVHGFCAEALGELAHESFLR